VEISKPVDIASMKKTFDGPTHISPVVSLFFCPPEMPRRISSPTIVSAHLSNPNICNRKIRNGKI
jgi:hypothetical protein